MGDWLQQWLPSMDDRNSLKVARWLTIASAVAHAVVAIVAYQIGIEMAIVDVVLGLAGFSIGLLLGLYALGLIAPRTSQPVALTAFAVGAIVMCCIVRYTSIYSYWYTLVGSSTIVIVGVLLSAVFGRPNANKTDSE